jgi:hypothetical protein
MLYPSDLKSDLVCTADSVCRPCQISWIRAFGCSSHAYAILAARPMALQSRLDCSFRSHSRLIMQSDDILNLEPRWLASGRNSSEGGQAVYRTSAWRVVATPRKAERLLAAKGRPTPREPQSPSWPKKY